MLIGDVLFWAGAIAKEWLKEWLLADPILKLRSFLYMSQSKCGPANSMASQANQFGSFIKIPNTVKNGRIFVPV
jgi:hypothetical protein